MRPAEAMGGGGADCRPAAPWRGGTVVFFCGSLREGGAERVLSILLARLTAAGVPVELVLYYDDPPFYPVPPGVKTVFLVRETGSRNLARNVLWLRRHLRAHAGAAVSFLSKFNILALAAALGTGVPVVAADRSDPRRSPANPFIRLLRDVSYRFAAAVVVQTERNRAYFPPGVRRKCAVIRNPADMGDRAGLALRTEHRQSVVTAGRLMPVKNHALLLLAFSRIHGEFPGCVLTIYGDGPERAHLERLAGILKLDGAVRLPGTVRDLHERMSGEGVFVLSSKYEGMPNALIEAMCLGLPVISTRVSGAEELIRDGENGLLVPVGDAEALASAMRRMLSDTALRERCAREAVLLNETLEAGKIAGQWLEVLTAVGGGKRKER